jgi:hypothetical protein
MFKLGLDFHGIIDTLPNQFSAIAEAVMNNHGDVHIITGNPHDEKFIDQLKSCGFHIGTHYSHIFSIETYLNSKGNSFIIDSNGNKSFDIELWNAAKSEYCVMNHIDLHIDDSAEYCRYFITPYLLSSSK